MEVEQNHIQLVSVLLSKLLEKMVAIRRTKRLKCKSDAIVMEVEECITQMFKYLKKYKDEPNWVNVRCRSVTGENERTLVVHIGSGFDSWKVSNNIHNCCIIINTNRAFDCLTTAKT